MASMTAALRAPAATAAASRTRAPRAARASAAPRTAFLPSQTKTPQAERAALAAAFAPRQRRATRVVAAAAPRASAATEDRSVTILGKKIPERWTVVFAIFVAFVLCNMDKVNMSVAIIPMAKTFGWTGAQKGLVSSAFFYGYAVTQVPGGFLAAKFGGKLVLGVGVLLWSLGTLIAPVAAQFSIYALCFSRLLVGLGEGVAPPAATGMLAKWVPAAERGRAVSAVFGGLDVGSVLGLLIAPPLILHGDWPLVFYIFGVLGFVWLGWWNMFRDAPEGALDEDGAVDTSSGGGGGHGGVVKLDGPVPWLEFFKTPAVWAIIVAHFCFNVGYYSLLAWLPSFYAGALSFNVEQASYLSIVPYVAMIAGTAFVGVFADQLITKHKWSITAVRKLAQNSSFLIPAAINVVLASLTMAKGPALASPFVIIPLITLSLLTSAFARAGLYCNHQDLSPKYASILLGITNTAGAMPGVTIVALVGKFLDQTGSWGLSLFVPIIAFQVFGAIVWQLFASGERIYFTGDKKPTH